MWWFLGGMIAGAIAVVIGIHRLQVGILQIDYSDPDDGPYMFLKVTKGVVDIARRKYVLLEVSTEDLGSRN